MGVFYGRDAEMAKLNTMYNSPNFEFAVIYGRRRVGKTTLIREFIKDKRSLFFVASESTAGDNLLSLSRLIGKRRTAPVFADFESALLEVFKLGDKERFVFVIDEFPYLAGAYRGISSLLQILIDHKKGTSKLMLILCGSSMSFMENQVLGYQSPLYGRRTAQFKIRPFTFFESRPFFVNFAIWEQAVLYGFTGGIPEYLQTLDDKKPVRENIIDSFLSPTGRLFEEPANLLKQELREPATYNVIIEAIASGASRLNDISTKCGLESNKCAKYLASLIILGLIEKERPYGVATGKRSIYRLEDLMFRFWYRFVFPNISAVVAGLGEGVFEHEVEPGLNAYMGLVFEVICRQWFFEMAKREALPFFVNDLGRFWGTNPKTHGQEEIDVMAARGAMALFAECKWKNEAVGPGAYYDLKRKSELFSYEENYFYILTKTSPSPKLRKLTQTETHISCFSFQEMVDELGCQGDVSRPLK